MYIPLILALLIVTAQSYPWDHSATVEDCIKKEELVESTLKIYQYLQHPMVPSDDDEYNKFYGCYWKSIGLLDKFGNVDVEKIDNFFANYRGLKIPKNNREEAIEKCKNFHGGTCGQKAVKTYNCINLYFSELGLLKS
ncbi:hypothetical protein FQR65_LT07884 [Abscondita terminalis]|nr:hypothetical protein FQR65_LT07884 [Abscondita terminalis]